MVMCEVGCGDDFWYVAVVILFGALGLDLMLWNEVEVEWLWNYVQTDKCKFLLWCNVSIGSEKWVSFIKCHELSKWCFSIQKLD